MNWPASAHEDVQRNARTHDRLARGYDTKHAEIYNPVEQSRLEATIDDLLRILQVNAPEVLDFGAGTGNLTLKFARRGCRVTAADVSSRSLELLLSRVPLGRSIAVELLTGNRIPFADASFDIVAAYSVLHHIPEYLQSIREMARVLRAGGLLYIDHEFNAAAWEPNESLSAYRKLTRLSRLAHLRQLVNTRELFTPEFVKTVFIKAFVNRRYEREGDLHVWPDDHIEWDKVEATLREAGVVIVRSCDYLLFQPRGSVTAYRTYARSCSDTRYVFARKG